MRTTLAALTRHAESVGQRVEVRTADGRELLPMTEISRQIDQSYAESAALSKEQEGLMLYQNMQSDIVQQVMRRLATVHL